jgi:Arc/MetJ family transcription regulator
LTAISLRDTIDIMARTLVNLNEALLQQAMQYTGMRRKVDVVNEGLRTLVQQRKTERLFDSLRGRVRWEGDPVAMRHGRSRSG